MKNMFDCNQVPLLFSNLIPKLLHLNDGLIFTLNHAPYYPGTCPEILKWKPKDLNTIDLQLNKIQIKGNVYWQLNSFKIDNKLKSPVCFDYLFFPSK